MSDWAEIRFGRVVLEDDAALVLNKPAGISVMGERSGADLVRLAADAGQQLFPAHRIDKVTSGAVLLAKELRWHGGLTRQFNRGAAGKAYLAITRSAGLPERGSIDLPLSVGRKNRVRVAAPRASIAGESGRWAVDPAAIFSHVPVYPSVTTFARLWQGEQRTLLLVQPLSGRRHQIRVHLAWIGHPIAGDPLFGAEGAHRTHLHSWRLAFEAAWRDGERLEAEAPPGEDFWEPLQGQLCAAERPPLLAAARLLAEQAPPPPV